MFLATALVGLREGLEAALVVVILVAFLVKTRRTWALKYVWVGVGVAIALSVLLGAALTFGTRELTFEAQELIGGIASIIAVGFVTVMVFWMKSAARSLSGELKGQRDRALGLGPLAITLVGFLAVGREGLETAVFFYATAQSAGAGTNVPLLGWVVGIGGAIVLGLLIYRGALRINLTTFFRWTGIFLVLVAAGILPPGLPGLQEAGVLPGLGTPALDAPHLLAPDSWDGTLLKGIFNFSPRTTVLEAAVWLLYVAIVLPLFLRRPKTADPVAATPAPEANAPA